nr:phosphatidylglycerophosphatase A [Mesopusillimonas faecipullorum]
MASPARWFAFGFGSGLIKPGPGTWGTLLAWGIWVLAWTNLSDLVMGLLLAWFFAYGCWICQLTGKAMGRADHSGMVWDEMVAFWLVLWLIPESLAMQAIAFVLFRFFDIVKPPPIAYFDARLKNGLGVMWDDILAAGYTLLAIAILTRLGVSL